MGAPAKIICLVGPTASGKTAAAIDVCRRFGGEVVSADSMQIYRGMDVGTAKPTMQERGGIPHHMMDIVSPSEDYSVARYVREASACVDDILSRGALPVVTGGTGLYIDSLVGGLHFAARPEDEDYRRQLQAEARDTGTAALHRRLSALDPESGRRIHPNDAKRVIRALEVIHVTGATLTQHNESTRSLPPRYDALYIGLTFADRDELYRRIDERVDRMLQSGLEREAAALRRAGIDRNCTAMQGIGYREMLDFIEQKTTHDEMVQLIKRHSRQYAKRQLIWLRRNKKILWINQPVPGGAAAAAQALLERGGFQHQ